MKTKSRFNKVTRQACFPYNLLIKGFIICTLLLIGVKAPLGAQSMAGDDTYTRPSWWFGAAAGANLNFYRGSTHQLSSDFALPGTFHDGFGAGLYLAPLIEYHRPNTVLGFMLQAGYDSRRGKFDQILTACNCPSDLSTNLNYITVEPSLRIAPFRSDFYIYAGPRFAYNWEKAFTYEEGINPDFPNQVVPPKLDDDFSNIDEFLISMQVGAGYDIFLTSNSKSWQAVLSPFVSFQPYYGQEPRTIETWNITTLRVGAALKFGRGRMVERYREQTPLAVAPIAEAMPGIKFTVISPANIPLERRVRETFPIRNYVFFDLGSTEIPDRYVLLEKNQVKDFKEDRMEVFEPKRLSGRSDRVMVAYYNILNILGERLVSNPSASVQLTGTSENSIPEGLAMAESVKKYLVDVFGIKASRITTEGSDRPRIPSEQLGGTKELDLLREEDRRVTILSDSPELMMEYQTGADAPLRPVELDNVQVAPLDSYLTFTVKGAKKSLSSWNLEIRDRMGIVQNYGPYTNDVVIMPGKSVLGDTPEGLYKITMVGKAKNGTTVKRDTTLNMVLWIPGEDEMGMRYSIIYEFDDSRTTAAYEKYLTDIVAPKIPKNGSVIIHGYTDNIGDADYNQQLSLARANDARGILESHLKRTGRTDVKFTVFGFGEDQSLVPFRNDSPEERFYNRSVIIDIIPPK